MNDKKIRFILYVFISVVSFITAGIYIYLAASTGIKNHMVSAAFFTVCSVFNTVCAVKTTKKQE